MPVLPETITTARFVVRAWRVRDVDGFSRAVAASAEHLRPWMAWLEGEPMTRSDRVSLIERFSRDRESGGDAVYGVFDGDTVVGGCGLHRRGPQGTLHIGYWVHVDHLGRGIATEVAAALTGAAFAEPGIDTVVIHHDRANHRSRRVPQRLGFAPAGEQPVPRTAPAHSGVEVVWAMTRGAWTLRRPA
jgi:ribosomal-protein-serine acetyltransferase